MSQQQAQAQAQAMMNANGGQLMNQLMGQLDNMGLSIGGPPPAALPNFKGY